MNRSGIARRLLLLVVLAASLEAGAARGQGPTLPSPPERPGDGQSSLGPALGSSMGGRDQGPGSSEEILGGRPGPSVPRVPPSITRPGQPGVGVPAEERITAPPTLPLTEVPL